MKTLALYISFAFLSCASPEEEARMPEKKPFGQLPDGTTAFLYTLSNKSGMRVTFTDYGAAVVSLIVPDRAGKPADVVLGYDSLSGYVNDRSYFGAIVGRYANRIAKGEFTLDGKSYHVTVNDGENHLHGGAHGFHKVLWTAETSNTDSTQSIKFTHTSPDGDEGYPGNVTVEVTYTLTNNNELVINYKGTTDRTTILNPSHHSYFNLNGSPANTILDHMLEIDGDSITPIDKGLIPTGTIDPVANTPMDFRTPTAIGTHINEDNEQLVFGRGYDHNWVLKNYTGKVRKVAEVYEPVSGRVMDVFTDRPGLQFYSGNFLDGTVRGKGGVMYQHRTGLCLEAQHYPDSPNHANFPSVTLKPGDEYRQTTIYHFSVR